MEDFESLASELITLMGTTGAAASGNLSLTSDLMVSAVTKFVIPKGMTLKIWGRLVAGPSVTVNFQYANDGSTFRTIVSDDLASTGELDTEKRRPHIFRSSAGTEAIQIAYSGATVGTTTFCAFDVELTQDR